MRTIIRTIFFLNLFFSGLILNAQGQQFVITNFNPSYTAKYQYRFMRDTTVRNLYSNTTLLLFFNNEESYCISKDRFYNDSLKIAGYEKILQGNNIELANKMTKSPLNMRSTSDNYLIRKEYGKKSITYFNYVVFEEMYYKEQTDFVKWQLVDSNVTINGFDCKVAKKRYHGRNYTAYYAPSIPSQDGPLKFGGLPGLIIQLKDDLNEVDVHLTDLKPSTEQVRFFQSTNPIKTERKKLYNLMIEAYLDPSKWTEHLNVRVREEDRIALIRRRQEALKAVNNRLEKE